MFNILNVRQIFKFETAIIAYEINKNMIKNTIDVIHMSSRHNYGTRNANQIYQQRYRTNAGKYHIARTTAIHFNPLLSTELNLTSFFNLKKKSENSPYNIH